MRPSPREPRAQHQHVHVINPWGELASTYAALGIQSATFNPLDVLDRHDRNAVAVAQSLAAAMCPQERGGKDGFWTENASSLLTAVLLWLADAAGGNQDARPCPGDRQPAPQTASGRIPDPDDRSHRWPWKRREPPFAGRSSENAAPFVDMAPETYSGVMSNLARFTKFLSDPQIKAATATSSFSMTDLTGAGTGPADDALPRHPARQGRNAAHLAPADDHGRHADLQPETARQPNTAACS